MSYLLDKKIKRKKVFSGIFFALLLLFLIFFRAGIWSGLSSATEMLFHPVLVVGRGIGEKFDSMNAFFASKKSLMLENENLKRELDTMSNKVLNYDAVLDENTKMKEIFGRTNALGVGMTLASILAKPNQSLYDTLLLDAGKNNGVKSGQRVFALGNIPIGRIEEVGKDSSKVVLFSSSGEKTEVMISGKPASTSSSLGGDIFMEAVGRGGGNFEMIVVKDLVLEKGTSVFLRGITSYVLGTVETIISDPRDSFQKALLVSPINVQELKFVEVEK